MIHSSEIDLLTLDNIQKFLFASNSPPRITPPVDFHYIDKDRVDELYNQIEPDLVERERTVATTGSVKGKLGIGVGGAVNAEAEAGKSESSSSSFTHPASSSERKCVELMDYIVDRREPKYYTNAQGWFLGRENAALAAQMEKNKHAPVDWSTIHPIKPVGDRPSMETPTEKEKREAERKVTQYQSELEAGLKSLRGYVFVSGDFDRTIDGDTLILTETFSVKPLKVSFRIKVPKSRMSEFQSQSRLRLRVFGDVIRPLSSDGYVDVLPIAAY